MNRIGSHGATLIADCLATNPFVKGLSLARNALTDSDALKLAMSLKANTTLRSLELIGNDFTAVGYQSLFDAMRGSGTLNSIHANHVCSIDLFGEFELNEFDDPVDNRIT